MYDNWYIWVEIVTHGIDIVVQECFSVHFSVDFLADMTNMIQYMIILW